MDTNEIIIYASIFSVAVPILTYLFYVRHLSKHAHILGALMLISALSDIVVTILSEQKHFTAPVSNSYYIVMYGLLSWFYYELFIRKSYNQFYKTVLLIGSGSYLICLIFTLLIQGLNQYHTLLWTLSGLFVISYCVAFFHFLHKAGAGAAVAIYNSLWFVSGITIYFLLSTGIFVLFQYLITNAEPEIVRTVWSVHNVGNIIKNIFIAIGFVYTAKR